MVTEAHLLNIIDATISFESLVNLLNLRSVRGTFEACVMMFHAGSRYISGVCDDVSGRFDVHLKRV